MSRMRTAVVEQPLETHWHEAVQQRTRFELGLIIGQISPSKRADSMITAVQVPPETETDESQTFEDLSMDWVQEFAKQIDRLLPGGIHIVGLYVLSSDPARSVLDQASYYLRAVVESLQLPPAFETSAAAIESNQVHYTVHICPNSSKRTAKTYLDILDVTKTESVPGELKSQTGTPFTAVRYTTSIAVDRAIVFTPLTPSEDATEVVETRVDELQQQLEPVVQQISKAVGILSDAAQHKIKLLSVANAEHQGSSAFPFEHSIIGRFQGALSCVAYVSDSEANPVDVAVRYLKQDFIKSLLVRLELVLDKWTDDAAACCGTTPFAFRDGGSLCLPRRCVMPWLSGIGRCDVFEALMHVFQDDEPESAMQNALEILGVNSSDLDANAFRFIEGDAVESKTTQNTSVLSSKPSSAKSSSSQDPTAAKQTTVTSFPAHVAMASVLLVLLLAVVLQRLLL